MRVIFDLDGTLALNEHRVHHIRGEHKDYDAFHLACVDDQPHEPVIRTLWAHMWAGHKVRIWSGRSDMVRTETEEWLLTNVFGRVEFIERVHRDYCINSHLQHMRVRGDHRPDVVVKREWLNEARAAGKAPDLVYDDRNSVVEMWREEGIPCFQVALGDF